MTGSPAPGASEQEHAGRVAAHCSGCGRTPGADEPVTDAGVPWTWSVSRDGDRETVLCPDCAREHARSIEAKLDDEWW
jgi:hypothetical protein